MNKIALINHGCPKNLVDSELMLGLLAEKGYEITLDDKDADVVIVNTCSFIHDAEQESVQSILQMVDDGKRVIVTGCLPQKHKEELKEAIPEVCAMIGTSDINSHILKCKNNISSDILTCIKRCNIKIRSMSLRLQHHLSVCIIWKQTKFTFWGNIRINSHLGCLTDNPL